MWLFAGLFRLYASHNLSTGQLLLVLKYSAEIFDVDTARRYFFGLFCCKTTSKGLPAHSKNFQMTKSNQKAKELFREGTRLMHRLMRRSDGFLMFPDPPSLTFFYAREIDITCK